MLNTLAKIAEIMNGKEITWAVGGSLVLQNHGLVEEVNDIDLLVAEKDIESVFNTMNSLGRRQEAEKKDIYTTKYFYKYKVGDVNVDIMGGFGVKHGEGEFNYLFDQQSIANYITHVGELIPFTSLEDWFVIYQLLPNREYKVVLIEEYLKESGLQNAGLLNRAVNGCLPYIVKNRIESLLNV